MRPGQRRVLRSSGDREMMSTRAPRCRNRRRSVRVTPTSPRSPSGARTGLATRGCECLISGFATPHEQSNTSMRSCRKGPVLSAEGTREDRSAHPWVAWRQLHPLQTHCNNRVLYIFLTNEPAKLLGHYRPYGRPVASSWAIKDRTCSPAPLGSQHPGMSTV